MEGAEDREGEKSPILCSRYEKKAQHFLLIAKHIFCNAINPTSIF